jgi:putative AlgH/UPF0301 family transcriptional regulator
MFCCAKKTAKEPLSEEAAKEIMATNGAAGGPAPKYTADQAAALAVVENMFGTWGAGKLKTDLKDDEWLKNASECFTDNASADFSGVNHPMFKVWGGGPIGMKNWFKFLDDSEFPNMAPKFYPAAPASGQVLCDMSFDWHYKGAKLDGRKDIFVFNVVGGKVDHMKQYWHNPKEIEQTICPLIPKDNYAMDAEYLDDQSAALGVVLNMFGTWGAGQLKTDLPDDQWLATASKLFTQDASFDASGVNHPMFKLWEGGPANMKTWFKFLDDSEFPGMNPTFVPGPPGSNQVTCIMKYSWSYKGGYLGNRQDMFAFTVTDGKVSHMKQYWEKPMDLEMVICSKIPADNYGM